MRDNRIDWVDVKYDTKIKAYRPHLLSDLVTFLSKADAIEYAHSHSFPQAYVQRVGSRFWSAWGLVEPGINGRAVGSTSLIYETSK